MDGYKDGHHYGDKETMHNTHVPSSNYYFFLMREGQSFHGHTYKHEVFLDVDKYGHKQSTYMYNT